MVAASAITVQELNCVEGKYPDSKVFGANMGPIWGQQDPGGPHVGPMYFPIWVDMYWLTLSCITIDS